MDTDEPGPVWTTIVVVLVAAMIVVDVLILGGWFVSAIQGGLE